MKPIIYEFRLGDGTEHRIVIDLERTATGWSTEPLPEWTRLEYQRCPDCPLRADEVERCPTAVDLSEVTAVFAPLISVTRAEVTVRTEQRDYVKSCDVQTGLRSLLGLMMATSGCPVLGRFRDMARFHLPFSTWQETLVRTVGHYLVERLLEANEGGTPDYDLGGLHHSYEEVQRVNRAFKNRIAVASSADANLNAVTLLFTLSALVKRSLDDELGPLRAALGREPVASSVD